MRKTIKLCKDFADTLDDIGEKASEEKKDAGGQGRILALIKSRDSQLDDVGVFEYLKHVERDVGKGLDLATLDVSAVFLPLFYADAAYAGGFDRGYLREYSSTICAGPTDLLIADTPPPLHSDSTLDPKTQLLRSPVAIYRI
jgi:hypothetical protein